MSARAAAAPGDLSGLGSEAVSWLVAIVLGAVGALLLLGIRRARPSGAPRIAVLLLGTLLSIAGASFALEAAGVGGFPALAARLGVAVVGLVGCGALLRNGERLLDLAHAGDLAHEASRMLAHEAGRRVEAEDRHRQLELAVSESRAATEVVRRVLSITEAALLDLPLDAMMEAILARLRDSLTGDTAVILLLEEETATLRVRAAIGLEEEVKAQVRVPVGAGFAGRIAQTRAPLVIDEVDPTRVVSGYLREKGIRSLVGVPLLVEGRLTGVMHVGSTAPRRFTPDDVMLLQLAAREVAVGIERAAALELERRANSRMEEASRAKDAFLATLSHELRTPLNAIVGWAELLSTGQVEPGEYAEAFDTILRASHAQAHLVNDILDVSRLVEGRLQLDVCPCSPSDVLQRAVETIEPAARGKRIAVAIETATVAPVVADPVRLQQVIWNLLSNAVKFTPAGGRIEVELRDLVSHVVFEVRDSGQGIRPGFLDHVFERFTQQDSSSTRLHGGLGLGLAIARHIVELHGGAIQASSEGEGRGATFTVMIPRGPLAGRLSLTGSDSGFRAEPLPQAPVDSLAGRRVLAVDDEEQTRRILRRTLSLLGAEVETAATADAALALLAAERFDLLVCDIAMPVRDGFEVIRTLRGREAAGRGHLLALALSAYATEEDRRRAIAAGFDDHVAKPVLPQELALRIVRLLAARGADAAHR